MAFDKPTRNALSKMVAECRRLLTDNVREQLQATYGIQPDGTALAIDKLAHLDDRGLEIASALREWLEHLFASETGPDEERRKNAFFRMAHETAFTYLNRLAALRMCEERGLVIECVRRGMESDGFALYERLADQALGDRGQTYHIFLECMFDELAVDLGVLFDRCAPHSLVFPTPVCIESVLQRLNDKDLAHLWKEDEMIGWIYQFFNSQEERREMRKSRSPRNSRELAVRNQFFTPRYVVEFLTDNTLGRIWYEMRRGNTQLKDNCRYLVRRPHEIFLGPSEQQSEDEAADEHLTQEELLNQHEQIPYRARKDPRDLKILDPACGSGHFLIYAFGLFETIYDESWEDEESPASEATGTTLREDYPRKDDLRRAVPGLILKHNLHGIDIDLRACQIAALALWLRAQQYYKKLDLKFADRPTIRRSNIVAAEPMPGEESQLKEFITTLHPPLLGQLVETVFEKMKLAGEAGSLLKIEEEISQAVADARKQWQAQFESAKGQKGQDLLFSKAEMYRLSRDPQRQLDFSDISDEQFWPRAESLILDALRAYAEHTTNGETVLRTLFSEDAAQGFAFIDLCRSRYDVLLMNPPFGASSTRAKTYINAMYPRTKGDLLANFIERILGWMSSDGLVGAISSRTPFYLGSSDGLRTKVLGRLGTVQLLADLGEGVLDATVEVAIYVLARPKAGATKAIFFRELIEQEKESSLSIDVDAVAEGQVGHRIFVIAPNSFSRLAGAPYAYWVSNETISTLSAFPQIEGHIASIRVGLQTSWDNRFLRVFWEVPPAKLIMQPDREIDSGTISARCLEQLADGRVWAPFSKTESAALWFSPITLVVNWAKGGTEVKAYARHKGYSPSRNVRSENMYFKAGFSYMLRSTRLVPYLVPAGGVPTAGRAQVYPDPGQEYVVLGICASNIGSAVARFSGEKFAWPKFQANMVKGLPTCEFSQELVTSIKKRIDLDSRKFSVLGLASVQQFNTGKVHPTAPCNIPKKPLLSRLPESREPLVWRQLANRRVWVSSHN